MRAVNLIPAEQRSGAAVGIGRSGGAAYAVMVVLGGFALLAFLYGRASHQISSGRAQAAALAAQAQTAQVETSRLAPYTTFIALREQRMNAVSELVDSRFDWAHAFHEFGRVLPAQVSVASLTGTIGGGAPGAGPAAAAAPAAAATPAPSASATPAASSPATPGAPTAAPVTSATPPGSVPMFALSGCATSQPVVALMLDRLRLMDGVSSVTLQSSTKAGASGGGGASGGCAGGQPAFSVEVTFDALPTAAFARAAGRAAAVSTAGTPAGGAR